MKAKVYTVEEANQILEIVSKTYREAKAVRARITEKNLDYEFMQIGEDNSSGAAPLAQIKTELDMLSEEFRRKIGFLERLGVQIRQSERGVVDCLDFFSIRNGYVVFLCWREGETSIRFWHSIDSGFAGRQPI